MMIDDGKLNDYSTRQVARLLNVSTQSVLDMCQKGGFGYRLSASGRWRIPRERLERILAERDAAARA